MSTYNSGTCTCTNGDATVSGSGTLWNTSSNVEPGDIFIRSGDAVAYTVASVTSNTALELTSAYGGVTGGGVYYGIYRDFTVNAKLPSLYGGDKGDWAVAIQDTLNKIDNFALGWNETPFTCTWASGTTFTCATDKTSLFLGTMRLKIVHAGGTTYHNILSSSYGAPNTTVTVDGTTLETPISRVYHSTTLLGASGAFPRIGLYRENVIINGGFTINQRGYVSAAVLATTVYGHDRWKAGGAGGDYSFTQLASPTTITIAANKTLIQVIEDKNVYGGTYVLSWIGTAQARYAINSATPAGSYAASPIIIAGQTAGTTMSVEFGNGASTGTLGKVQLELGSVATDFEFRNFQQELARCQRYFWKTFNTPVTPAQASGTYEGSVGYAVDRAAAAYHSVYVPFPVVMRDHPSVTFYNPVSANATWYNQSLGADSGNAVSQEIGDRGFRAKNNPQVVGDRLDDSINIHATATAEL